jgi:hypothetical protein
MAITISRANCAQRLRVPEKKLGEIGRCPRCRVQFKIVRAVDGTLAIMSLLEAASPRHERPSAPQSSQQLVPHKPLAECITSQDTDEIQETPFFTEDGAIIECPWFGKRLLATNRQFNRELGCPKCDRDFEVVVKSRDRIPFRCPNCLLRMEIGVQMAGNQAHCIRETCRYGPIRVPMSPIKVKRLGDSGPNDNRGNERRSLVPAPPVVIVPDRVRGGYSLGPRLCPRCGRRYVRNPSGICHKCQR